MEFRQLEYFIQICKEGSFTKAAEVLMVSQPTLSQQIRVLEQEFGTPLFDRVGRGIEINEAGKILYEKGISVMQLIKDSRIETSELINGQKLEMIIGIFPSDLTYLMPRFVQFNEEYPNISIKFVDMEDTSGQLLQNKIDIGISADLEPNKHIDCIHLFNEELALVVSKDHPWAEKVEIPFRELEKLPNVLFVKDTKLRKKLDDYINKTGISLFLNVETTSTSTLLNMVHLGVGATIMSLRLVESYNCPNIKIIRLIDPKPTREVKIYMHKDKLMPYTARSFINYIPEFTKDL
ncbi:LysR family cyn operon transcriptional activator [Paenibacillus sp. V4I3]|uniref:LysR family transcriptional regulator n=1 Tax=unclassified Paenibacillus TaxID=185978 RepID=UPI00278552A7|nr:MULTISPECIES: LysR family transcriptional regulator [unclassified Paenibacillus]MDQ0877622.1 LysR family cyn operon transcriptional activator [Paenibacillus sp. V4I3]MDQ0886505.1 LysR family cyn operon transcriptional activator [Paenibacillus sp. V4I9]